MQGKFRDSQKNNLGAFSKSELLFQKFFLSKRVFGWIVGVSTFLMLSNLRWQSEWQRVGLVRQVIDIVSKKRTPLKVSLKPTYGYAASKIEKQIWISLYKCVINIVNKCMLCSWTEQFFRSVPTVDLGKCLEGSIINHSNFACRHNVPMYNHMQNLCKNIMAAFFENEWPQYYTIYYTQNDGNTENDD